MTDRSTPARIIAMLTVLVLTASCAACTLIPPAPRQRAATRPAPSSPAPAGTTPARPGLAALLPDSPAWIKAAAALAARFAAAYTTWSYHQPPAAWLARLHPMTAAQLYPALARAAWTPGILAQRDHGRQAAAGTVTGERIRDLTPGSVIIIVQVRQAISSTGGLSEVPVDLAVTVARAGGGQAVWDVEPAADGDTGGDPADALSP